VPKKKEKVEPPKLTVKANERDTRSHSRSRAQASAPTATKNPTLPSLSVTESRSTKNKEPKKDLAPAGKAKVLPPVMREQAKFTAAAAKLTTTTPSKTASNPAELRLKLEALESSLIEERERMEDNPGEVTAEAEEHYEELTKQARMLRKKLEMTGLNLSFQNDDPLDDSAPTPQAVRMMAQQMESLNASTDKAKPLPAPMVKGPSTSDLMFGRISRQASSVKQSLAAATEDEKNEDNDYADDDFEDDFAKSKPGTAKAPVVEAAHAHVEAPAKMLQTKQFSRKFEELELSVPDVSRYIKPIAEEDINKKHRRASITYASEEVFQVGTEEESASMRYSGMAAVHDALSFETEEQPYNYSPDSSIKQAKTVVPLQAAPVREEAKPIVVASTPSKAPEPEGDDYEEDTYEDEFADEDAETETKPVTTATKASVPVMEAFSPTPAATESASDPYDTPILASPPKDKFGKSSKNGSSFSNADSQDGYSSSPTAQVINTATPESVKVSPVPKAAPAPVENNYEEDNYEDAYEEEFEADASTRLPVDLVAAEEPAVSSTKSAASVPALSLTPQSVKKIEQNLAPENSTPSPAKEVIVESTKFSSPSAKISTKASPAKASASKKRAETPGKGDKDAGDDYGDDDFDEYDVSFDD